MGDPSGSEATPSNFDALATGGGSDVANDPSAIDRASASMDVFYRNTSGQLAADFWDVSNGAQPGPPRRVRRDLIL